MKLRSRHLPRRLVTGILTSVFVFCGIAPVIAVDQDKKRQWPPDPKRKYWDEALPPKDYMHAYRATGQMEAKTKARVAGASVSQWTRSGPLGNFPERDYNGRMGSIFLREGVSGYDVYAGASSGGLWWAQGTTGAPQWTSIGDGLPNPAVHAINIDPNNYDNIFVGTGDYPRYGGGGMFKTTDGGQNWTEVSLPVDADAFFEIFRSTVNENLMWACSSQGILRSINSGVTWFVWEDGFCTDMVMDPTDSLVQYAVFRDKGVDLADNGVYKTDDGWVTSTRILDHDLPTEGEFDRASIAICDGAEENLALLVETDSDLGGIFKSADYGETWQKISPPAGMSGFGQIVHAQAIAIRPENPDHIYAGSVTLWRTTDGGSTWHQPGAFGHADITQLHFDPITGPDTLWILNDGGIYKHSIGRLISTVVSWNGEGETGLNCSQIHSLDAERDMQVIGLQDNGTLESFDAGASWNLYTGLDGFGVEIIDSLEERYWYTDGFWPDPYPTIRIWRRQRGESKQEAILPSDGWRTNIFYDRFVDRVYTAGSYALMSTPETGDLGFVDEILFPPPIPDESSDKHVYGSQLYGDELYVTYWDYPKLTVCRKSGGAWTTATTANLANALSIDKVVVSMENPGESWVGLNGWTTSPKILHTTNYWNTYTNITGSLAGLARVMAIAVTPMNSKQIFVGTDLGVFRSTDGGATWNTFQDGLPVVMVTGLLYVPDPNRSGTDTLVVSTYGRGVYHRPITGPPLTYVDPDYVGVEDGMFQNPYHTLKEGAADTPPGGTLAVRGRDHILPAPLLINTNMLIRTYDGQALLGG